MIDDRLSLPRHPGEEFGSAHAYDCAGRMDFVAGVIVELLVNLVEQITHR